MKNIIRCLAIAVTWLAVNAHAQTPWSTLNTYQSVTVNAPASKVWGLVKGWDGLHTWHPVFSNTKILKGGLTEIGGVREVTVKDGPSFTEELLAYDDGGMNLKYKIIESPLPLVEYVSVVRVNALPNNQSQMVWLASYKRRVKDNPKPGAEDDDGIMNFVHGAYQAGLQNVKKMAESK